MKNLHSFSAGLLLALAGLLATELVTGRAHAASVGSSGYTNSFNTLPAVADWSTYTAPGAGADLGNVAAVDGAVQAVAASSINSPVGSDAGNPPAANAIAYWSSSGFYLQTRPTGNAATLLMCRLVNAVGADAANVTISYNQIQTAGTAEQVAGHRAYYSLTGAAGSWTSIPEFSAAADGRLTANLSFSWPSGGNLYVLWADDNADGGTDGEIRIDNFSALVPVQIPVAIISQPQSQIVGELQPVSFTVGASGNPAPTVQWYTNDVAIPDATNVTYSIPSAALDYNGLVFKAVLQNTASNVNYSVTSSNATLTVITDTIAPTIVSAGASFPTTVTIAFSEPLRLDTATNAANYSITSTNGNLTVSNVVLLADQTNVVLTTSPQILGTFYVLTVNGVRDLSAAANQIATNSQAGFLTEALVKVDVGGPAIPGIVTPAGNAYDITAGGSDIGGTNDQFTFNYQQRTGDFDVKVRVQALSLSDAWAKAGLMAREAFTPGSRYAAMLSTPSISGSFLQYRGTNNGATFNTGASPGTYPNTWLRLKRAGGTFTGYVSLDGNTWSQVGAVTIATMPATLYVGMAVTSRNTALATTAEFRDFSEIIGTPPVQTLTLPMEPPGPSTRRTGVIISEIMYHPRDATTNYADSTEFIELHNTMSIDERLSGYRISGSVDFVIPTNTILKPGAFLVIARNPAALQARYGISSALGPWDGATTNSLPGNSGTVRLRNRAGAVLLEVKYVGNNPWPIAADGSGHSLVLARPSYGEGSPKAWAASDKIGGSPGRAEPFTSDPLRPVVINEFLANSDAAEDYIELYNHSASTVNLSGAYLSDEDDTNKFRIPTPTFLAPNSRALFYESALGFALKATDGRIFLVNSNQDRVIDAVDYGPQAAGISSGRYPDGAPDFYPLANQTPGDPNGAPWQSPIVINEIMFNPVTGNNDDEFVELYNRSTNAVNVSRWRLSDGISFEITNGTVMAPGGYLVIANNAAHLRTNYPNLTAANTLGNYGGSLANSGERIALSMPVTLVTTNATNAMVLETNVIQVVVNEVTYGEGGRWGNWADGGGSSLELTDPRSDNRQPANWADSDETGKSSWTTLQITGINDQTLNSPINDNLHVYLLGVGECLVDDVEVINSSAPGVNVIGSNGGFESGLTGWTLQGSHDQSTLENVGFTGSRSLHLRAGSRGDPGANKVRSPVLSPSAATPVTLRAKARWLRGFPELLLRLHGGGLECVGRLSVPTNLGTPGARNSRAVTNAGPAIWAVQHSPIFPAPGESVLVTARASDPNDVASLLLRYRADSASPPPYTPIGMTDDGTGADALAGDGIYSATIPGQADGTMISFFIQAVDGFSPPATNTFPQDMLPAPGVARCFPNDAPTRECLIRFGERQMPGSFATYHQWITSATATRWQNRDNLNNAPLDGTFVYNNYRVVYNSLPQYAGSPWHRGQMTTGPAGSQRVDYVMNFPDDDQMLGTTDFVLNNPGNPSGTTTSDLSAQSEQTSYLIFRELDVHYNYRRYVHCFVNGSHRSTTSDRPGNFIFEDSQQPNSDVVAEWFPDDANGELYKIEDWFEFNDAATSFANDDAGLDRRTITGTANLKLAPYRFMWRKRAVGAGESASDYATLFNLIDVVSPAGTPTSPTIQNLAAFDAMANIEQWMRIFAVQHTIGNWDSYGYRRGKNGYTYKGRNGRFEMMTWDIDFTMGVGGDGTGQNLFDTVDPRVTAMWNTGYILRAYWRAYRDIVNGPLNNSFIDPILDAKSAAFRDNYINVDNNVLNTVKSFVSGRRANIAGQIPAAGFAVNGASSVTTSNNLVILTGTAPLDVKDLLLFGYYPVTFTSATAWSVRLVVPPGTNQLILQGYDTAGNPMAAIRSTNTVVFTGADVPPQGTVVITEVMYNPAVSNASFVEIQNTAANFSYDVSNWRLDGLGYTFPAGTILSNRAIITLVKDAGAFATGFGSGVPVFGTFPGTLDLQEKRIAIVKPGANPGDDILVDALRYENRAPWLTYPSSQNVALQVIDPAQDNSRPSNWGDPQVWRFASQTGLFFGNTNNGTNLMILFSLAGETYFDDMMLVQGTNAGVGPNVLANGDFESPLSGPWVLSPNMASSVISSNIAHSGTSSLRAIATSPGSALGSSIYQRLVGVLANNPAEKYTLSYWYRTSFTGSNITVRAFPTGSGVLISQVSARTTGATPSASNTTLGTMPAYPLVWLNEIQPNNGNGITDNAGQRDPWVELFNSDTNVLALDQFYLTDQYTNLTQWQFPAGTSINPGQHLLLFADNQTNQTIPGELHAPFRLSRTNGSLALSRLVAGAPQVMDYMNYSTIPTNFSYGSHPEGQLVDRRIFYFPTPGTANNPVTIPVRINEWLASNTNTSFIDPLTGVPEDWFELHNFGSTVADLSGCYLTDNLGNKTKWPIPYGTTIAPGAFLFIWADNLGNSNSMDLHVNFNLRREGEEIGLFGPDGATIDTVVFGSQTANVSQGRYPDGNGGVYYLMPTPTPGTNNVIPANTAAPTLAAINDKSVLEGSLLTFAASATDPDAPVQTLTWSFGPGAPAGASVNPVTGIFSWIPNETQGGNNYTITIKVIDNGYPLFEDTRTFNVTVTEVNSPPLVPTLSNLVTNEGAAISFNVGATDTDLPVQTLAYTFDGATPLGVNLDGSTGLFTWMPDETQGGSNYNFTVRVTDNGAGPQSVTRSFTITVVEVNNIPLLNPIPDKLATATQLLNFTVMATDTDLPAQRLTYGLLAGFPVGASINSSNGLFGYTPPATPAHLTNNIGVRVFDNGTPSLSVTQRFNLITVAPPRLLGIIKLPADDVALDWTSYPTKTYQLDYKNDLSETNWTALGSGVAATGFTQSATNAIGTNTQRFFRIRQTD